MKIDIPLNKRNQPTINKIGFKVAFTNNIGKNSWYIYFTQADLAIILRQK